jgi:hypothetical protein
MSAPKRIYVVEGDEKPRLVRAVSQAQAVAHVVGERFEASVADQEDLVKYMGLGAQVENAGE